MNHCIKILAVDEHTLRHYLLSEVRREEERARERLHINLDEHQDAEE